MDNELEEMNKELRAMEEKNSIILLEHNHKLEFMRKTNLSLKNVILPAFPLLMPYEPKDRVLYTRDIKSLSELPRILNAYPDHKYSRSSAMGKNPTQIHCVSIRTETFATQHYQKFQVNFFTHGIEFWLDVPISLIPENYWTMEWVKAGESKYKTVYDDRGKPNGRAWVETKAPNYIFQKLPSVNFHDGDREFYARDLEHVILINNILGLPDYFFLDKASELLDLAAVPVPA